MEFKLKYNNDFCTVTDNDGNEMVLISECPRDKVNEAAFFVNYLLDSGMRNVKCNYHMLEIVGRMGLTVSTLINKHPELYNEINNGLNNYKVTPHEYGQTISIIPQNT